MYKSILASTFAILFAAGSADARGGGGHGGGGGFHGGVGGSRGGYGGAHYGGYGRGYDRGFYGRGYGYGGLDWGYGLGGYGYDYPYYGYGGSGYYPYYDNYSYPYTGSDITSGSAVLPYSSVYPAAGSATGDVPSPVTPASGIVAPPASPPAATATSAATISVIVPEGGQVWFNGSKKPPSDNGSKWTFTTQKLEPGKTYVLDIKATWKDGTKDQSYDVPLRVQAGDNMTVDMTKIR
jgi:uncharacterized protein (TIGR03000 family)